MNDVVSPYPINTWYVGATAEEIANEPLGRRIAGRDMVFFRDIEGRIVCLEDFCPHRGLPLSMGNLEAGHIVCAYHGLRMGPEGAAVSMPLQNVERFPCVHVFPVVERYGFVWIWPGEKELANPTAIPEFEWADNPAWAYGGGVYHIDADYRLMIDNLMDLTHETYVHKGSIGQSEIDETPVETKIVEGSVETHRHIMGITAPPFWQTALEAAGLDPDAKVDRWQVCHFIPPSHVMIDVGVALAGQGGPAAPPNQRVSAVVVDFITPESDGSMWYFWGMARNFMVRSSELTDQIRQGQRNIFAEDIAVLERQQQNVLNFPDRRLLTLNIDAGGRHARRMLQNMIAAEKEGA